MYFQERLGVVWGEIFEEGDHTILRFKIIEITHDDEMQHIDFGQRPRRILDLQLVARLRLVRLLSDVW
jgi:hypothetical protein